MLAVRCSRGVVFFALAGGARVTHSCATRTDAVTRAGAVARADRSAAAATLPRAGQAERGVIGGLCPAEQSARERAEFEGGIGRHRALRFDHILVGRALRRHRAHRGRGRRFARTLDRRLFARPAHFVLRLATHAERAVHRIALEHEQ